MRIVDLSDKNIRAEFAKTRLPQTSYRRFKKYVTDLDIYYYEKQLDSPRMPERIFDRANCMVKVYITSIRNGNSEKLADSFARNFAANPSREIQQDYIKFLAKYCRDNNLTDVKMIESEINSLGLKRYVGINNTALLIYLEPYLSTEKIIDYMSIANPEQYRELKNPPKDVGDTINKYIILFEKMLYNKHFARHAKMSTNHVFFFKKILLSVNEADLFIKRCDEIIDKDVEDKLTPLFENDVCYLQCMVETIKDIYKMY